VVVVDKVGSRERLPEDNGELHCKQVLIDSGEDFQYCFHVATKFILNSNITASTDLEGYVHHSLKSTCSTHIMQHENTDTSYRAYFKV
jgi:hypothetical protein